MGRKLKVTKYRYSKTGVNYKLDMSIDLSRFDAQYQEAQYVLDSLVMDSMVPFMPMRSGGGNFINVTRSMSTAIAGTGKVVAAAPPFGRFLYEGKVMVDEKTGSTWAKKDARKVLVSQYAGKTKAKEDLDLSKGNHPDAQPHWFDAAKRKDGNTWIKKVKQTAGGGRRG